MFSADALNRKNVTGPGTLHCEVYLARSGNGDRSIPTILPHPRRDPFNRRQIVADFKFFLRCFFVFALSLLFSKSCKGQNGPASPVNVERQKYPYPAIDY